MLRNRCGWVCAAMLNKAGAAFTSHLGIGKWHRTVGKSGNRSAACQSCRWGFFAPHGQTSLSESGFSATADSGHLRGHIFQIHGLGESERSVVSLFTVQVLQLMLWTGLRVAWNVMAFYFGGFLTYQELNSMFIPCLKTSIVCHLLSLVK